MSDPTYLLYYWPFIPGRGEPVRLTFEIGGIPYRDVAREAATPKQGAEEIQQFLKGERTVGRPFAPPFIVIDDDGDHTLHWQTANLCALIAHRHGLVRGADLPRALELHLTLADVMDEAHDTHHPISVGAYYEDQKEAAKDRSKAFRDERIPKFLGYFEAVASDEGTLLGGEKVSYVDAICWHVLEGLAYAFPATMASHEGDWPKLEKLRQNVTGHAKISAYLDSDRRMAFNEHGIFRHYPELDETDE
jgi:glutathione S-transferase